MTPDLDIPLWRTVLADPENLQALHAFVRELEYRQHRHAEHAALQWKLRSEGSQALSEHDWGRLRATWPSEDLGWAGRLWMTGAWRKDVVSGLHKGWGPFFAPLEDPFGDPSSPWENLDGTWSWLARWPYVGTPRDNHTTAWKTALDACGCSVSGPLYRLLTDWALQCRWLPALDGSIVHPEEFPIQTLSDGSRVWSFYDDSQGSCQYAFRLSEVDDIEPMLIVMPGWGHHPDEFTVVAPTIESGVWTYQLWLTNFIDDDHPQVLAVDHLHRRTGEQLWGYANPDLGVYEPFADGTHEPLP